MEEMVEQIRRLIKKQASVRKVAMGLSMDRAQLVRSLKIGTRPRIDTVVKILDYLGYELRIIKRKGVKAGKRGPSKQTRNLKKEVG